jgi:hypothetical protein
VFSIEWGNEETGEWRLPSVMIFLHPWVENQDSTVTLIAFGGPSRPGITSALTQHDELDSSSLPRCHNASDN